MSGDIKPYWERIVEILNENSFLLDNVNFWGHNDADMLETGYVLGGDKEPLNH
jgi:alpha-galactosidase